VSAIMLTPYRIEAVRRNTAYQVDDMKIVLYAIFLIVHNALHTKARRKKYAEKG